MKDVLNSLFNIVGFKLKPRFFAILFIGIMFGFGADYFLNDSGEIRLRIFIFGVSIIAIFTIESLFNVICARHATKKAVSKLSSEDCEFVLKCYCKDEYFNFDYTNYSQFQVKWAGILYIPTGKSIVLYEPYKICVYEYAIKLIKKKKTADEKKNKLLV